VSLTRVEMLFEPSFVAQYRSDNYCACSNLTVSVNMVTVPKLVGKY
jgi:hypothetical protein